MTDDAGAPATSAPAGITYAPSQVCLEGDLGDVFAYTDDEGTTKSLLLAGPTLTVFPASPLTIEPTTTVTAVTVWWER